MKKEIKNITIDSYVLSHLDNCQEASISCDLVKKPFFGKASTERINIIYSLATHFFYKDTAIPCDYDLCTRLSNVLFLKISEDKK